ncbi:MAG: response regulator transcription factor [Candidatus Sulfotelmatobacter sp.]
MVRIFLVDDNAMIRSQLRTVLEKQNEWVVVGEAEDGRRAIEKWDENAPNLTVMDFVMPEMDGLEASRRLTQYHPGAPILMVTVDPSKQLEQEAKKAGVKGLVAKADIHSLFAAVEALLNGKTYFHLAGAAA